MKLNEAITLTEGLSPVLFHAVPLDKALWIIKNQLLRSDKRGHISFSRSRTNTFMANMGENMEGHDGVIVVLELDGRKLMANHKGRAVDSFAPSRDEEDEYSRDPEFDYMEDRIILPNGQGNIKIPNNGVFAIHFIDNDGNDSNKAAKVFNTISHPNKYVYETIRDFQQRKMVDPSALQSEFNILGRRVSNEFQFLDILDDIMSGSVFDPTNQDISEFAKAFDKWKHDSDVKTEMKELVRAYNMNGVRITKASELLSKSHLL